MSLPELLTEHNGEANRDRGRGKRLNMRRAWRLNMNVPVLGPVKRLYEHARE
jgi:hypothetical protein